MSKTKGLELNVIPTEAEGSHGTLSEPVIEMTRTIQRKIAILIFVIRAGSEKSILNFRVCVVRRRSLHDTYGQDCMTPGWGYDPEVTWFPGMPS